MIGRTISHYRILERIGAGGMGVVYKAEDTRLKRFVALKFLPADLTRDEIAKKRLLHEAQAISTLQHHNIATIHEIAETDDGQTFICMDYYEGETLKVRLARGPLSVEDAIDITTQIARGLEEAHRRGIVHRDIKPANVVVTTEGVVKVLDFGLARLAGQTKLTKTGTTVGTIAYMSPEQVRGDELDGRSDIFSLGVAFYEMLTGATPFEADHEPAIKHKILNVAPPPLRNSGVKWAARLESVAGKMLAKEPRERYQSASSVISELTRLDSVSPSPHRRRTTARRIIVTVFAAIALAAAGLWVVKFRPDRPQTAGVPVSTVASATNSIAVLPFVDLSPSKDQEYFSDGLSEELINVLVKIPDLKVSGRTSSFYFKGKNEDLRTIGEKLGVDHILEGSVRKAGDKIRITAQLVKTADGFHLWSQTYDRTLDDVFAVQDNIAQSVARELKVTLLSKSAAASSPNAEAHDLVLQANYILRIRTPETTLRARRIVEQALALSPDYAPAWVAMAGVYGAEMGATTKPEVLRQLQVRRREALARALALDPDLVEAISGWAVMLVAEWEFTDAQAAIQRALALDPKHPWVLDAAGYVYMVLGETDKAVKFYQEGLGVDPLALTAKNNLASTYVASGRLDAALALFRELVELEPRFSLANAGLGEIYLLRGDVNEARSAYARWAEMEGRDDYRLFGTALVEHTAGNAAASEAAAIELEQRFSGEDPVICAQVRSWRGDFDAAFRWLENGIAMRDPFLVYIKGDTYLRTFRADPRWDEVLKRIGLPPD